MKEKRRTQETITIDPDLKNQAEDQLRKEIELIDHWMKNYDPQSQTNSNTEQLHLKYQDMRINLFNKINTCTSVIYLN